MVLVFIPRDTQCSAGHPSDNFLGYQDDALYRNIIWRYKDNACFMTLSKQNNNKTYYHDLPARYENKIVPNINRLSK